MAVAALIVSIVAILLAGVSAWYTRKQTLHAGEQAREAKRLADIENERHARELKDREERELAQKRADLRLVVVGEENLDESVDEGTYRYTLVITNEGPAEARDVEVEIVSAWENQLGTRACFADGSRKQRPGRVPLSRPAKLPLKADATIDFGDLGECDVWWRDDSLDERHRLRTPVALDWR